MQNSPFNIIIHTSLYLTVLHYVSWGIPTTKHPNREGKKEVKIAAHEKGRDTGIRQWIVNLYFKINFVLAYANR